MPRAGAVRRSRQVPGVLWDPPAEEAPNAPARPSLPEIESAFCVLSSSSSGNCSALISGSGRLRRATLIDCGLSPLRTRALLARVGLTLDRVDGVLVTHLDSDHVHPNWARALPRHARVRLHASHADQAVRQRVPLPEAEVFRGPFTLSCGATVTPTTLVHDEWGVTAFRIETATWSLGYATDVGRPTKRLISALAGVDLLAIESNYCPAMQEASDRPEFLKRRIMGGRGHLSNEQCAQAVQEIAPRAHVVLLHLSRHCNTPDLARAAHGSAAYRVTVAHHEQPTALIGLSPEPESAAVQSPRVAG